MLETTVQDMELTKEKQNGGNLNGFVASINKVAVENVGVGIRRKPVLCKKHVLDRDQHAW